MRGRVTSSILALILVAGSLSFMLIVQPENVKGDTLFVGGAGFGNYTTIQSAIDAAQPGDIVYVFNGSYPEAIVVARPLTIIGEERNATTVDGSLIGNVISISAIGVNISEFTIIGSGRNGGGFGIYLLDATECSIANNNITGNLFGILVENSHNSTLSSNTVSDSQNGIVFRSSSYNTVSTNTATDNKHAIFVSRSTNLTIVGNEISRSRIGVYMEYSYQNNISNNNFAGNDYRAIEIYRSNKNVISDNIVWNDWDEVDLQGIWDGYDCIEIDHSKGNTVSRNTVSNTRMVIFPDYSTHTTMSENVMVNSGIYMWGDKFDQWNTHEIDTSNIVNGKPVHYWKNVTGGVIPQGAGQVILANCTNVVVRDQELLNTSSGIKVGFSSNITLTENTISGSHWDGIGFVSSTDSTISFNNISDSVEWGLWHSSSSNNTIEYNLISNTIVGAMKGAGIDFWDSHWNIVSGNKLQDNEFGMHLTFDSTNNLIINNSLENEWTSFQLRSTTDGNWIYHNNILTHASRAIDLTDTNSWDNGYPSGGNYWMDYAGVDLCSGPNQDVCPDPDGIGDTPYVLDIDSRDRYPLMSPVTFRVMRPPRTQDATLSGIGFENVSIRWSLSPDDGGGYQTVIGYRIFRNLNYDPDGQGYQILADLSSGTSMFVDALAGEGDPNNYFYRICAVDTGNDISCAAKQAGKFTRPLLEGPNLVSVPLIQADEGVKAVFQTVKWDKAWKYDSFAHEWKWHMKFKPFQRELERVSHREGIWINVTEISNLTVAGIVPLTTVIQLHEGWNLVGFPSFKFTYAVADLKADTGATRVEGYDPNSDPYYLRELADWEILEAGYGYWIKVDSGTVWTVDPI